ncbi:ornithine cyclodeaminase family protein [Fundicoccus culcitae]|uniref:Ornithine cyclodeaminase family protein n=1 Tax=Fundicoccus culcitae TaxID=2969821 RepID=A0ABY5P5V6_9LACT|nr:ornithine cyclodeaminase family protein [Fundicoccus culcitae]UUX34121.1 ornithine cyclodeaminase family protein [Fundicoccus culcitae]
MTKLLSQEMIKQLISMKEAVDIIDKTFIGIGEGTVVNPPKVNLDLGQTGGYPYYDGFVNAMPAYVGWNDSAGLKWVAGVAGERKAQGLPYINAMLLLIDPKLGEFVAVMDGTYISNLRTGAQTASALSTLTDKKHLTVGMFGSGVQARFQIEALVERFVIDRLVIWNHRRSTAEKYAEDVRSLVDGEVIVVDNPEDATKNDVVITVTGAHEPIITKEMIEPGTIVMPMGSFQEISDELILAADYLYVDHVYQALHRGALEHLTEKGLITPDDVTATIGEVAAGKVAVENLDDAITILIPIGMGAMDVAVGGEVYKKAVEQSIGEEFEFITYE